MDYSEHKFVGGQRKEPPETRGGEKKVFGLGAYLAHTASGPGRGKSQEKEAGIQREETHLLMRQKEQKEKERGLNIVLLICEQRTSQDGNRKKSDRTGKKKEGKRLGEGLSKK